MILVATALLQLVKAEITTLTYCQYKYANCTHEVLCRNICENDPDKCQLNSCDGLRKSYTDLGMSEYGECFSNSGAYYLANCTGPEPLECADYDLCHVGCTSSNLQCAGCSFIGQYVNGSDNCDDQELHSAMVNIYDQFEDFRKCFKNTASGQDYYVICNMGSSESMDWARIIIPIVSITAVYCCIWFVWRQSEADEKSFWKSKLSLSLRSKRMKKTSDRSDTTPRI
jgi:hypothetical protein